MTDKKKAQQQQQDNRKEQDEPQSRGSGSATTSFPNLGQKFLDAQMDLMRNATMSQSEAFRGFLNSMQAFTNFGAVFKTTVQKAGRISIPEAERAALGIKEGDLVQVVVLPLRHKEQ